MVYDEIPKDLLERVEDVLLNRRPDAADRLTEFAESVKSTKKTDRGKELAVAVGIGRGTAQARLDHGHDRLYRRRRRGSAADITIGRFRSSKARSWTA